MSPRSEAAGRTGAGIPPPSSSSGPPWPEPACSGGRNISRQSLLVLFSLQVFFPQDRVGQIRRMGILVGIHKEIDDVPLALQSSLLICVPQSPLDAIDTLFHVRIRGCP